MVEKVVLLKKINVLVILLFALLILVVYKNINSSINPRISLRKTINMPIEGEWSATRYVFINDSGISEKEAQSLIGKKAVFKGSQVKVNNSVCTEPSFKVKVVNSKSYFQNNLKIRPESLGIKEKQVKVITVFSKDNFFDDFVQINDNVIITYNDGLVVFFARQGVKQDELVTNNAKRLESKITIPKDQRDLTSKSGVILGLKSYDIENGGYDYRTIWIRYSYGRMSPVNVKQNIIVPRKNGFWEIGVHKKYGDFGERDIVWGSPIMKNSPKIKSVLPVEENIKDTTSEILFVGNEFISTDNCGTGKRYFSVLPMDKLNGKSVDFSQIFSNNASKMFQTSAENYLRKIGKPEKNFKVESLSTNWSVSRRSGRWILRGRIKQGDFDIIYPAQKTILTSYDDLYPSFAVIKEDIPSAVDAYTSPNRDFVVILTDSELFVYSLNTHGIGKMLLSFPIKKNEKVVMSQWAMGKYVDSWNNVFKDKLK